MKMLSSELTDDEIAVIRSKATRWRDDPSHTGFVVRGHS
jgi:hypothetical protein